jgi:hypothetical protein
MICVLCRDEAFLHHIEVFEQVRKIEKEILFNLRTGTKYRK